MKTFLLASGLVTIVYSIPYEPITHQSSLDCPPGYSLLGKRCEQVLTDVPHPICLTGEWTGQSCVSYTSLITQCPLGTMPRGKECAVQHVFPAQKHCPPGYFDKNGACTTTKQLPVVEVCEVGTLDQSGQCVLIESAAHLVTSHCPAGYVDEGKGCMIISEYDCTPPPPIAKGVPPPMPMMPLPPPPPPPMPFVGGGGYKRKKRMLGAKKNGGAVIFQAPPPPPPPAYMPMPMPMPIPPPSKGGMPMPPPPQIAVIKQMCQRREFAPMVSHRSCPPGFIEQGKNCISKKTFPPLRRCKNGSTTGDCFEVLNAPHLYTCPEGTLVGEQCQSQILVNAEVVCPAGTTLAGDQCAQYSEAKMVCPNGMNLEGKGMCVGRNYAEPTGQMVITCTGKDCWQHV